VTSSGECAKSTSVIAIWTRSARLAMALSVMLWSLLIGVHTIAAQECPLSPACDAVFDSVVIPNSSKAPSRLVHSEDLSPDGLFMDEAVHLTYNRDWSAGSGWLRDDSSQPTADLDFESYWVGAMEFNVDMSPAGSNAALRPFGLYAKYDGSITQLNIGSSSYAPGAAGVSLSGGTGSLSNLLGITDQANRSVHQNMIAMIRQNGTSSFAWRSGGVPRLNLALQPSLDANGFGNYGVMKFVGEWDTGEPILNFESTGIGSRIIQISPLGSDVAPRFKLMGDGAMSWGPGTSSADTDLYRSANNTLKTDGNLIVAGNFAVTGTKSAIVETKSYGSRALYAMESPENWFEDFGSGKLVNGEAMIRIEPMFAETVNVDQRYHVFVTATGECSLYVTDKGRDFFKVKSLKGSTDCGFEYRIVAKRRGYAKVRLSRSDDATE